MFVADLELKLFSNGDKECYDLTNVLRNRTFVDASMFFSNANYTEMLTKSEKGFLSVFIPVRLYLLFLL